LLIIKIIVSCENIICGWGGERKGNPSLQKGGLKELTDEALGSVSKVIIDIGFPPF